MREKRFSGLPAVAGRPIDSRRRIVYRGCGLWVWWKYSEGSVMAVCYGRELKEFSEAARCDGLILFVVETVGLEPPSGFLVVGHARGQGFDDEPAQLVVALRGYQRALVASAQRRSCSRSMSTSSSTVVPWAFIHPYCRKSMECLLRRLLSHPQTRPPLMQHGLLAQANPSLSVAVCRTVRALWHGSGSRYSCRDR